MNILKTVLSAGLGLGLSLTVINVLAIPPQPTPLPSIPTPPRSMESNDAEVLAAEELRFKAGKGFSLKNLFSFKDKKYRPNISFSGFYGQDDSSYGSLDLLYPVYQKNDRLVFIDLRGLQKKSPVKEFNVGGGYRWLSSDKQKLYGAYGFFDRKMSENNNWFNQVTIGGELKTDELKVLGLNTKGLSISGNVYLPVGTKSYEVGRETIVTNAWAKPYKGDKFTISYGEMLDYTIDTEYALTGVDLEVGHVVPEVDGLKAYLGGYYFSHSKVDKVIGPRATLIYDLSPLMPKKLTLIDHVELETSIQHDKPRGTTWYAGLRLQMQLGSHKDKPKLKGLEKQLTAFVRRDLDVVDEKGREFDRKITAEATWTKDNGQPYVGKIVSTEEELKALAQGKAKDLGDVDIIGVKGVIPVTGAPYADATTSAAIRLNYGQSITGQGLTFTAIDGNTYNVKIVNSGQGISGADPSLVGDVNRGGITLQGANGQVGHLLQVFTDADSTNRNPLENRIQIIEDLILRVPENAQQGGESDGIKSSVISNLSGKMGNSNQGGANSFGHIFINHIDANSNIFFSTDTNHTGKIDLIDSRFTLGQMMNNYGGMVHLLSKSQHDLLIGSIDNNELNLSVSAGNNYGQYFDFLNGSVINNRFGSIEGQFANDASGIYVKEKLTGVVDSNSFASITGLHSGEAYGIYLDEDLDGVIANNNFVMIQSSHGKAYGVYVGRNLVGSVSANEFNAVESSLNQATGLYVVNTLSGTVVNNTFSKIKILGSDASTHRAYGIYTEYITGAIRYNNFEMIESFYMSSGIKVKETISGNNDVSYNVFGTIQSMSQASQGIYVEGNVATLNMSGNVFNHVYSGKQVAHIIWIPNTATIDLTNVKGNIFNAYTGLSSKSPLGLFYKNGSTLTAEATFKSNQFSSTISEENKVKGID